jgi:hypothetical protein
MIREPVEALFKDLGGGNCPVLERVENLPVDWLHCASEVVLLSESCFFFLALMSVLLHTVLSTMEGARSIRTLVFTMDPSIVTAIGNATWNATMPHYLEVSY